MSGCRRCADCMWWWDLYDTGERKCYNRESNFFHEATNPECKCAKACNLSRIRKNIDLGYYKKPEECAQ